MTQPSLLDLPVPRPHKRQRQTAREVYRVQRAQDTVKRAAGKEDREAQVLRCLAAFWNARQFSPTALELLDWMMAHGERAFDVNSVRPRITALVAKGLVEARCKRQCHISGKTVHAWAVREIGSERKS